MFNQAANILILQVLFFWKFNGEIPSELNGFNIRENDMEMNRPYFSLLFYFSIT